MNACDAVRNGGLKKEREREREKRILFVVVVKEYYYFKSGVSENTYVLCIHIFIRWDCVWITFSTFQYFFERFCCNCFQLKYAGGPILRSVFVMGNSVLPFFHSLSIVRFASIPWISRSRPLLHGLQHWPSQLGSCRNGFQKLLLRLRGVSRHN